MNRKPSNLGLNFSFRAARSAGERPPWFLPKTRTRASVSRSRKKTRTLVLWVSNPQVLRRNLNEDGVEFAAPYGGGHAQRASNLRRRGSVVHRRVGKGQHLQLPP